MSPTVPLRLLADPRVLRLLALPDGQFALVLWTMLLSWARDYVSADSCGHVRGLVPRMLADGLDKGGAVSALVSCGLAADRGADGIELVLLGEPPAAPSYQDKRAERREKDLQRKRLSRAADRRGQAADRLRTRDADSCGQASDGGCGQAADKSSGGTGGSEISSLSSPSVSPSPPGSELDQLADCNARDGERDAPNLASSAAVMFELRELVAAEYSSRCEGTVPHAPASQWRDACATVQQALAKGLYPDARSAMRDLAVRVVDVCAADKRPDKRLGLALQQTTLGAQLRPVVAGGRQLSALAQAELAKRRVEGT